MSKELEAFKDLTGEYIIEDSIGGYETIEQRYPELCAVIIESLTPPTADEVCEALSGWLKEEIPTLWNYKVYHDNGGFHYYNNEDYEIYLVDYDEIFERIFFKRYLPPRLVTLIGRFYEGLEAHNVR